MVLDERRKVSRKNTLIQATASDLSQHFDVNCIIRDASKAGCRLVSSEIGDLPKVIRIVPNGFANPLLGKIVWRDKKAAGVEFISREEAAMLLKSGQQPDLAHGVFDRLGILGKLGFKNNTHSTGRKGSGRRKGATSDFISTVVHELRTPITALIGTLGLLTNGKLGALPKQVMAALGVAFRNADRLSKLVNDLLDVNKIESGKMEFDFEPTEIEDLVENAIETNRGYGEQFGVSFKMVSDIGAAYVNIDGSRIEQVLANLLSNAAKFSPEGGEVVVTLKRVGSNIRILVADKGIGIPHDKQKVIFEKFGQADAKASGAKKGTGLGLNISKAILEAHSSEIELKSAPGEGSTFWFDLPEKEIIQLEDEKPVQAQAG